MWSVAPTNRGGAKLAGEEGGIPSGKHLWQQLKPTRYGMMNNVCAMDGAIYMASAQCQIVALDASDGSRLWATDLPEDGTWGIAVDENYVWLAPFVLDRRTGEIVDNAEQRSSCRQHERSYGIRTEDSFLWEVGEPVRGLHRFYPGRYNAFYPQPLADMHSWHGARVYGIADGKVVCLDMERGEVAWRLQLPLARNGKPMVCGHALINIKDKVYVHVNFDSVWCIDGRSGELEWKFGPDEIEERDDPFTSSPPSTFLVCGDRIYFGNSTPFEGKFQCRSTAGDVLWEVDVENAKYGPIAGDLIFGSMQDRPVAWDRWTGEVVWRADKPMAAPFYSLAIDNKVIYTTTTGMLRCFAWKEPYVSPGRPAA